MPTLSKKLKVQWAFYGIDPIEGPRPIVAWRGYRGIARFLLRCHRIPPRAFILCGNLRNSCAQFPFDACNSIQLQTHKEETRSAAFFFVPLTFKSAFHSQAKWPFNVCLKCTFVMWNERWITALLIFPLPFSSFLFFFLIYRYINFGGWKIVWQYWFLFFLEDMYHLL